MSVLLNTRGFCRVDFDGTQTPIVNGIGEAQTNIRMCLPYGAASGWKVTYQGFSGPITDNVVINNAAVWILPPGGVLTVHALTFSASASVTIAADSWVESDPIAIACVPGTLVWAAQFYKNGTQPNNGLPHCGFGYNKELTGVNSNDGALSGAGGSLTDKTQDPTAFNHSALGGPLNAGASYLVRMYQPLAIVGSPHSSWSGTRTCPIFIGDSINVGNDDFGNDNTTWTFQYFSGRFAKDNLPFMCFGQGGSVAGGFIGLVGTPIMDYIFSLGLTVLVNEYGVNDLRTRPDSGTGVNAGICWSGQRAAVATAVAGAYGTPYLHTTMTPCSDQADLGAGVTLAAFTTERGIFNDMVRSGSLTLANSIGFCDICQLVETDPIGNSNVWVTGTA